MEARRASPEELRGWTAALKTGDISVVLASPEAVKSLIPGCVATGLTFLSGGPGSWKSRPVPPEDL